MKFKFQTKLDQGFSLVEVLIAIVILALVGTALLNGISSGNLQAKKGTSKQINFNYLTAAAEVIAKTPFVTCNQNTGIPRSYIEAVASSPTFPVRILKVEGLLVGAGDGTWYDCTNWPTNATASYLQKITIVNADSTTNNQCSIAPFSIGCSRVVFKNLTGISGTFNVSSIEPITLFYGKSRSINLSTQNSSADAQVIYFILPGSNIGSTCANDNLAASIASNVLTVCVGANYSGQSRLSLDIGGFDVVNSVYATPTSILIDLYSPIVLNTISPALVTEIGALKFTSGNTVQLSTSGGNGYNITYAQDPINTLPTGLTLSTSGLVGLSGTGLNSAGNLTVYTLISGGGQAINEATSGNFSITVKPPLSLDVVTGTGSSTNPCTGTTSTTSCTITLKTTAGTGLGSSPVPTLNPTATTNVTYTQNSSSYDTTNKQWVFTLTLSYNATQSTGYCKTKGAGTTNAINATVTDTFIPKTSSPVSFYLKC